VIDAERSRPLGCGLSRVGGDQLEVAVAQRHQRVVGPQPDVGSAERRPHAGGPLERVDRRGQLGHGVDEMVGDGHDPMMARRPGPGAVAARR
jgi:hypothetical protein